METGGRGREGVSGERRENREKDGTFVHQHE